MKENRENKFANLIRQIHMDAVRGLSHYLGLSEKNSVVYPIRDPDYKYMRSLLCFVAEVFKVVTDISEEKKGTHSVSATYENGYKQNVFVWSSETDIEKVLEEVKRIHGHTLDKEKEVC